MNAVGNSLKLETKLVAGKAEYHLPLGENKINLSQFINKKITLNFTGKIHCISTGELIKKTYGQGYSYKAYITLAECDMCILKPELCHFAKGTCREPDWGLANCFQTHVVYLSETSAPKVGITRLKNIPNRWIDQGAVQVVELFRVATRKDAGDHEILLAKLVGDKTDWRKMLTKEKAEFDLLALKKEIMRKHSETSLQLPLIVSESENTLISIEYPGEKAVKLVSLSFDKDKKIEGELLGIRGQYLIFPQGVLNIRKFQGYQLEFSS